MNKLANLLLEKEILLESGTNELEILVFDVGRYVFGVNVAKVREVLPSPAITHLPNAHPSIRGVFKLRNQVVPCVSLADYLGEYEGDGAREGTCILTDLNQQQTAFLVDRVERIHRLSWENVLAVPPLDDLAQTPVTALARCQDRLILMLDFEMILDQVTEQYFRTEHVENPAALPREQAVILLAEDSPTVREAISQTLSSSGYSQLVVFENGKQAWHWLEEKANNNPPQGSICDLVIADIEMPQVDGLHLTKRIKGHPQLSHIPVLLYSSIITPENKRKGEAVGANAQVAKPDLCHVVEYADNLIFGRKDGDQSLVQNATSDQVNDVERNAGGSNSLSRGQVESPSAKQQTPPVELLQVSPNTDSLEVPPSGTTDSDIQTSAPASAQDLAADIQVNGPAVTPRHESEQHSPNAPQEDAQQRWNLESSQESEEDVIIGLRPDRVENAHLWDTFALELQHRWKSLSDLRKRISAVEGTFEPGKNFDLVVDVARILHTIKSAAMVVPVEIVTRATHALESLIEAGSNRNEWPSQAFNRYCDWLEMFFSPVDQTWDSWSETGQYLAADLEQQSSSSQGAEQGVPSCQA